MMHVIDILSVGLLTLLLLNMLTSSGTVSDINPELRSSTLSGLTSLRRVMTRAFLDC